MKTKEINQDVKKYILRDIELTLLRLGINVTLEMDEHGHIDSTPFQTMPVLFKEWKIYGTCRISEDSNDFYYLNISLSLDWKHFGYGENGCSFGGIQYRIRYDISTPVKDCIHRTSSLEI